jgi:hypothetical protein
LPESALLPLLRSRPWLVAEVLESSRISGESCGPAMIECLPKSTALVQVLEVDRLCVLLDNEQLDRRVLPSEPSLCLASFSWEHMFVTSESHPYARFRRALETRALWAAEDAAQEMPSLSLEDALQLVHLYAERGSPKYERAAMRWLERYLIEGTPRLQHFADVTMRLAKREPGAFD